MNEEDQAALSDIKNEETMKVPDHLKDSHYPGAKKLGHGKDYKYPHDLFRPPAPCPAYSTLNGFASTLKVRTLNNSS